MAGRKARAASVLKAPMLHYPSFAELSDGLVSLQELVAVVNAAHADLPLRARNRHKEFTTSMASNYVKQKLTPPPAGKRYARLHVCMILFAATIKLAYSNEDVLEITRHVFAGIGDDGQLQRLQDHLAEAFNAKTNEGAMSGGATEGIMNDEASESEHGITRGITNTLVDLVSSAFAQKVRSLVLLERA